MRKCFLVIKNVLRAKDVQLAGKKLVALQHRARGDFVSKLFSVEIEPHVNFINKGKNYLCKKNICEMAAKKLSIHQKLSKR